MIWLAGFDNRDGSGLIDALKCRVGFYCADAAGRF